jgi:hypothetical protein
MTQNPDLQNMRRIVCLANSRKLDGRCVAGKLYSQGKFGKWIRPISNRKGQELSEGERCFSNGIEPALLDLVEFTILKHNPTGHQPENYGINPQYKFQHVGRIRAEDIVKEVDNPTSLWSLGFQSKSHGRNDLVPLNKISEVAESLYLIQPKVLRVQVMRSFYKTQVRGHFQYAGEEYNLTITDPAVEQTFIEKGIGEYEINEVLLTVSLAEKPWVIQDNPGSSGYYKLIAGVIDLSSLGRK